jgi:hypothetical protein
MLPLVLVVSVLFALVIVALARLVTTDLAFADVAAARAERQAAAISAIDYAVERIALGQTLCNSPSGDFGPVDGDIVDLNDTTVTIDCDRVSGDESDIAGWTLLLTGEGTSADMYEVQGGGTKRITGPVYVDDIAEIDINGSGPQLVHEHGDLWFRRSSCPSTGTVPGNYAFEPATVHGPRCTTASWTDLVAEPPVPDLSTLTARTMADVTTVGTCAVFPPGRYTDPLDFSGSPGPAPDVYFQSGVYWFDDVGRIEPFNSMQRVWFGHPGSISPLVANPDCEQARTLDPNVGGSGAVAYLSGDSRLRTNGQVELFPRRVGDDLVSIHALGAGSPYGASNPNPTSVPIVRVRSGSNNAAIFHGLVFAPGGFLEFANASNTARQQLLGGAVLSRIDIGASASATGFRIARAATPALVQLRITAVATDGEGISTTVVAVVDHRPDLPLANRAARVAVRSLNVAP